MTAPPENVTLAEVRAAIAEVRGWYPTDVFPEEGKSQDCLSASMARLTCDNIAREVERRWADRLQSAQPAAPVAVAWQARMSADGYVSAWSDWPMDKPREPKIGRWSVEYRPLYTHPAPAAGGVDEAMVERAAEAIWNAQRHRLLEKAGYATDWASQVNITKRDYRKQARAALQAPAP